MEGSEIESSFSQLDQKISQNFAFPSAVLYDGLSSVKQVQSHFNSYYPIFLDFSPRNRAAQTLQR